MTSKQSPGKAEVKSGGMKPSTSAPSSLPIAKPSHSSLFVDADEEDDDDLFAPKQEPRYFRLPVAFSGPTVLKRSSSGLFARSLLFQTAAF